MNNGSLHRRSMPALKFHQVSDIPIPGAPLYTGNTYNSERMAPFNSGETTIGLPDLEARANQLRYSGMRILLSPKVFAVSTVFRRSCRDPEIAQVKRVRRTCRKNPTKVEPAMIQPLERVVCALPPSVGPIIG